MEEGYILFDLVDGSLVTQNTHTHTLDLRLKWSDSTQRLWNEAIWFLLTLIKRAVTSLEGELSYLNPKRDPLCQLNLWETHTHTHTHTQTHYW